MLSCGYISNRTNITDSNQIGIVRKEEFQGDNSNKMSTQWRRFVPIFFVCQYTKDRHFDAIDLITLLYVWLPQNYYCILIALNNARHGANDIIMYLGFPTVPYNPELSLIVDLNSGFRFSNYLSLFFNLLL